MDKNLNNVCNQIYVLFKFAYSFFSYFPQLRMFPVARVINVVAPLLLLVVRRVAKDPILALVGAPTHLERVCNLFKVLTTRTVRSSCECFALIMAQ